MTAEGRAAVRDEPEQAEITRRPPHRPVEQLVIGLRGDSVLRRDREAAGARIDGQNGSYHGAWPVRREWRRSESMQRTKTAVRQIARVGRRESPRAGGGRGRRPSTRNDVENRAIAEPRNRETVFSAATPLTAAVSPVLSSPSLLKRFGNPLQNGRKKTTGRPCSNRVQKKPKRG